MKNANRTLIQLLKSCNNKYLVARIKKLREILNLKEK